jgi:hypothetical protein
MVDTPYFKNDLATEFWIIAALQVAALGVVTTTATRNRTVER